MKSNGGVMKAKKLDAVEIKRRLQKEADLAKKFGHLRKSKKIAHVA